VQKLPGLGYTPSAEEVAHLQLLHSVRAGDIQELLRLSKSTPALQWRGLCSRVSLAHTIMPHEDKYEPDSPQRGSDAWVAARPNPEWLYVFACLSDWPSVVGKSRIGNIQFSRSEDAHTEAFCRTMERFPTQAFGPLFREYMGLKTDGQYHPLGLPRCLDTLNRTQGTDEVCNVVRELEPFLDERQKAKIGGLVQKLPRLERGQKLVAEHLMEF
jgi:hypothetical protein